MSLMIRLERRFKKLLSWNMGPSTQMKCNIPQHKNCQGRLHPPESFSTPEGRKRERWETRQEDTKQRVGESKDQTKRKTSM